MVNKTNIIILGGGYAGIEAAKTLYKNFKRTQEVSITLIDQNIFHGLITELHEVAGYRVEEDSIKVSYSHIFEYTDIHFVHTHVEKVLLEEQKVILQNEELIYDYLVIGVGSEPSTFGIPGINEYGFTLWSLDDAIRIKNQIIRAFESAQHEKDIQRRKELLTFVVGGAGFTGIEMMGELIQWTKYLPQQYKVNPDEIRLVIIEALPVVCHTLSHHLQKKIHKFLLKAGVEVMTDAPITEVTPHAVVLNNGTTVPTQTLIWTSGVQANSIVKEMGLKLTKRNRIEVNKYLQATKYPKVYAIGDNAYATDEAGKGVPPFVEAALQTAQIAAYNITNDINGINKKKEFKPEFHGLMVSIGSVYAVADIMGFRMSGLFATAMKHLVNLHYLFGIGGLETCIDYLKHHFLSRARRKPLAAEVLIDHLNARSRSYWFAITRIILGFIWLFSAIDKIHQGWLFEGNKMVSGASLQLLGPNSPSIYIWFVENFIFKYPLLFQTLVTFTELFLALSFLSGAFTFLGTLIAIFMNINFFLAGTGQLYLLLAHIPLLGGAGRAFGLDHYIMPYLMQELRSWQRNKAFNVKH